MAYIGISDAFVGISASILWLPTLSASLPKV
jgi:hypothetical protein